MLVDAGTLPDPVEAAPDNVSAQQFAPSYDDAAAQQPAFESIDAAILGEFSQEELAEFGAPQDSVEDSGAAPVGVSPPATSPVASPALPAPTLDPVKALLEQNKQLQENLQQIVAMQAKQFSDLTRTIAPPKEERQQLKRPEKFETLADYEAWYDQKVTTEKLSPLEQRLAQTEARLNKILKEKEDAEVVARVDRQAADAVNRTIMSRYPNLPADKRNEVMNSAKELMALASYGYGVDDMSEVAPVVTKLIDTLVDAKIEGLKTQAKQSVQTQQMKSKVPQAIRASLPGAGGEGLYPNGYSKEELRNAIKNAGYEDYMEASQDGFRRIPRK